MGSLTLGMDLPSATAIGKTAVWKWGGKNNVSRTGCQRTPCKLLPVNLLEHLGFAVRARLPYDVVG